MEGAQKKKKNPPKPLDFVRWQHFPSHL